MPTTALPPDRQLRGVRRGFVTKALNARPAELIEELGLRPAEVSQLLNGTRDLAPEQADRVARLLSRKVRALFMSQAESGTAVR